MARAVIHTVDAIPENFVQNQFCIESGSEDLNVDAVTTAIQKFYRAIASVYPSTIAQTGHELKYYELPGVQPNYPTYESAWTFATPPSGNAGPSELAICLSFAGTRIPGQPQPRRRGRVYIGPLDGTLCSSPRPDPATRTLLTTNAAVLGDDINAITGHIWCVWSEINGFPATIVGGYVDDAWDVQRRRGIAPSTRTTFTVVE